MLVGRSDGLRARLRRATGLFTWLDRSASPAPAPAPAPTPTPTPAPTARVEDVAPEGWLRVLDAAEVRPGEVIEVLAGSRPLAVANVGGTIYAVDSTCPHAGGPLGDGHLDGHTLTCPWHGWGYDVRTGRSLVDESVAVGVRPVKVVGGAVWVAPD